MPTVRIQEKNYSESIMVLKLKDGELKNTNEVCWKIESDWTRCLLPENGLRQQIFYMEFTKVRL